MKNITSIVEEINKDGQMTNERVSKIVAAMFEVDDIDIIDTDFAANNIYYKEKDNKEFFVNKSDDDGECFVLNFNIWDKEDEDNDIIESVTLTSIQDIYGAISIIAHFDQDPFDTVANLNNYGVTDLDTFFENVCKIDDGFFFDVEGKRIWVAKTTETSKHGDNVVEHNSLQAFALDEDGELIDNDLDGADLEFVNYKCDDDELANAYTTILNAASRLAK